MPSFRGYESSSILIERRRSAALPSSPFLKDVTPGGNYSYYKLPQQFLKLSILKLDGSCFEVQISRMASVAELKQAVVDIFSHSPKEGQGKISWSHVWGHFCLCYEGQKLVNDKDYIRNFGIKDGDQLHFIRHLSINYNHKKRLSKKRSTSPKQGTRSLPGLYACETIDENGEDGYNGDDEPVEKNENYYEEEEEEDDDENRDPIRHKEFKLTHFLKGWLSHSTLRAGRKRSGTKVPPPRLLSNYSIVGSKAKRL